MSLDRGGVLDTVLRLLRLGLGGTTVVGSSQGAHAARELVLPWRAL